MSSRICTVSQKWSATLLHLSCCIHKLHCFIKVFFWFCFVLTTDQHNWTVLIFWEIILWWFTYYYSGGKLCTYGLKCCLFHFANELKLAPVGWMVSLIIGFLAWPPEEGWMAFIINFRNQSVSDNASEKWTLPIQGAVIVTKTESSHMFVKIWDYLGLQR